MKSFSQTDTATYRIQLSSLVAKEVVKDLIRGDQLKLENDILVKLVDEYKGKDVSQSLLVANLTTQIDNYKLIVINKDDQIANHKKISETYKRDYLSEKRKRKVWQVVGIVSVTALLLL